MRDYTAQIIIDAQALMGQLASQELVVEQARKSRNKGLRTQAEKECKKLRRRLLKRADASSIYLYLNAMNAAQDVAFRTEWQTDTLRVDRVAFLKQWSIANLYQDHWATPAPILSILPPYSFFLQFIFTLAKPYLSRDDKPFYIIDNPIARDKVFQLPLVRPTSWKGSLCAALWQLGYQKEQDKRIQRLFGDIRDNESGQAGRLRFYPTFFTQTGLEIINPHDREKHVGKNPILFESVPTNTKGTFTLLYVPFDLIGQSENDVRAQVAEDLLLLAQGIQAMMTRYGFGAKTSSGFGVAKEKVNGKWLFRSEEVPLPDIVTETTAPQQSLARYLSAPNRLKPEYLNPDGTFRERSQQELKGLKKAKRQLYNKAKRWWEREGQVQAEQESPPPEAEVSPASSWDFALFEELVNQAERVAELLNAGGKQ